jgi:hypothetical protein
MKHKIQIFISIIIVTIIASCNNQSKTHNYILTVNEKLICDTLQIDTTIILDIRKRNTNKIEPFHYSLSKMYKDGIKTELEPIYLNGLVFSEQNAKSYDLVFELKDSFLKKGYTIFLLENNFNIGNELDNIAILKNNRQIFCFETS